LGQRRQARLPGVRSAICGPRGGCVPASALGTPPPGWSGRGCVLVAGGPTGLEGPVRAEPGLAPGWSGQVRCLVAAAVALWPVPVLGLAGGGRAGQRVLGWPG
jgi:hypothetical protein